MKCTLMPGIKSLSGSIKQKNGTRIIFKTFSKPSVNREGKTETRVYISQKRERTTPVSDAEKKQWGRFAQAAKILGELSETERIQYAGEWKQNKYIFNGKKYATLRGYMLARIMKERL